MCAPGGLPCPVRLWVMGCLEGGEGEMSGGEGMPSMFLHRPTHLCLALCLPLHPSLSTVENNRLTVMALFSRCGMLLALFRVRSETYPTCFLLLRYRLEPIGGRWPSPDHPRSLVRETSRRDGRRSEALCVPPPPPLRCSPRGRSARSGAFGNAAPTKTSRRPTPTHAHTHASNPNVALLLQRTPVREREEAVVRGVGACTVGVG